MLNLAYHLQDFGYTAEWQFFATSHGKSECDGIGGSFKRMAANHSLKRSAEHQILNSQQLYEFGKNYCKNITFLFVSQKEVFNTRMFLKPRNQAAKQIKDTQKMHSFVPDKTDFSIIHVKRYAKDSNSNKVRIF